MKYCLLILGFLALLSGGCEPIAFQEPPAFNNVVADALALVSPDTVQQNVPFTIQIAYPNVCGGSLRDLYITKDTLNHVFLQPILHQDPQAACPAVVQNVTITDTLSLSQPGSYELVAIGNYGSFRKPIEVVDTHTPGTSWKLQFSFRDRNGNVRNNRPLDLIINGQSGTLLSTINTGPYGVWDTTVTSDSLRLTYSVAGYTFHAKQGITEDGIIIIP